MGRSAASWRAGGLALLAAALMASPVAARGPAQAAPVNVPVSPDFETAYQEPSLAVDPRHHSHLAIAYQEKPESFLAHFQPTLTPERCLLGLSKDAGRTWSYHVPVGVGTPNQLPADEPACIAPKVAYGPSGVLYYAYQSSTASFPVSRRPFVATSSDGGVTFHTPVLLDVSSEPIFPAQESVAVDQASGRVYVAWSGHGTDPNRLSIRVASSTDQGRTFSAPVQANPASQRNVDEPSLVVGGDRTLYVGWRVLDSGNHIQVAASHDQGQTFGPSSDALGPLDPGCTPTVPVRPCNRPVEYLSSNVTHDLAAGSTPGQLFAVGWGPEDGSQTGIRRIFFSSSDDGGATWAPRHVVGIPAGLAGDDQARPSLTITAGGRIEILYQDLPVPPGGDQNIFEIHSEDGGQSFSAPSQINSAPSDSRVGPGSFDPDGTADLGAYLALASARCRVFTAWTDTRRGNTVTNKQDVFFAALPHPNQTCRPGRDRRYGHDRDRRSVPER